MKIAYTIEWITPGGHPYITTGVLEEEDLDKTVIRKEDEDGLHDNMELNTIEYGYE